MHGLGTIVRMNRQLSNEERQAYNDRAKSLGWPESSYLPLLPELTAVDQAKEYIRNVYSRRPHRSA